MQLWGLTGGIASGKSTVAAMLRAANVPTLDADHIYHQMLAPVGGAPSALGRSIAAAFGGELIGGDGQVDRRALGERVFGATAAQLAARQRLQSLTHPAIGAEVARRCGRLAAAGHAFAAYDVPLLFEGGGAWRFAGTLVVWVPIACQLARLMARNGLDRSAAQARLAAQLSLEAKRAQATWVIDNRGTQQATGRQVTTWVTQLSSGRWPWAGRRAG